MHSQAKPGVLIFGDGTRTIRVRLGRHKHSTLRFHQVKQEYWWIGWNGWTLIWMGYVAHGLLDLASPSLFVNTATLITTDSNGKQGRRTCKPTIKGPLSKTSVKLGKPIVLWTLFLVSTSVPSTPSELPLDWPCMSPLLISTSCSLEEVHQHLPRQRESVCWMASAEENMIYIQKMKMDYRL